MARKLAALGQRREAARRFPIGVGSRGGARAITTFQPYHLCFAGHAEFRRPRTLPDRHRRGERCQPMRPTLSPLVRRALALALLVALIIFVFSGIVSPLLEVYRDAVASAEQLQSAIDHARTSGDNVAA